jgi:hypothetical protein
MAAARWQVHEPPRHARRDLPYVIPPRVQVQKPPHVGSLRLAASGPKPRMACARTVSRSRIAAGLGLGRRSFGARGGVLVQVEGAKHMRGRAVGPTRALRRRALVVRRTSGGCVDPTRTSSWGAVPATGYPRVHCSNYASLARLPRPSEGEGFGPRADRLVGQPLGMGPARDRYPNYCQQDFVISSPKFRRQYRGGSHKIVGGLK